MEDPEKIMDEFDRGVIWLLKFLAAALLIVLYLIAIAYLLAPPPPERRVVVQPTQAEKRWLDARFKYHGIWACIEENGEHYFYRDGKKCKL